MRALLAGAVALHAHIGLGMARLAGLQVPPRLRGVIRIPFIDLRSSACLPMRFDLHVPLLPVLGMAVRTEFRIVAAIAGLRITRRLHRMYRDEIRPVRAGLVFAPSRQTPRQIGFDPPALVAIDTEGLLMAIRAITPRPLGQQAVLLHIKSAVVAHDTRRAMAILTFVELALFEVPVVGPGE